jgi:hypothetical protein
MEGLFFCNPKGMEGSPNPKGMEGSPFCTAWIYILSIRQPRRIFDLGVIAVIFQKKKYLFSFFLSNSPCNFSRLHHLSCYLLLFAFEIFWGGCTF